MRRILISSFLLAAFFASSPSHAQPNGMMISEFRTRGPNGANDEFIELFNGSSRTALVVTCREAGRAGFRHARPDGRKRRGAGSS